MTIQEAPAMTRREAYDTMIQHCRTLLDLNNELKQSKCELDDLNRENPNFHSVASFDEFEAMEKLADQLAPQIKALTDRINDIEVEMVVLRANVRDILVEYNFNRIQFITFNHGDQVFNIYVSHFLNSDKHEYMIRLASAS